MNRKLEILGRYLSSGIEVQYTMGAPREKRIGKLIGIRSNVNYHIVSVDTGKFELDRRIAKRDPDPEADVLPLLLTFEDLVTKQPDGSVPAVEIAKICGANSIWEIVTTTSAAIVMLSEDQKEQIYINHEYDLKRYLAIHGEWVPQVFYNQSQIQHYLVKLGFATPLSDGTPMVEGIDFVRKSI